MSLESDVPNADAQLEVKFYYFEGEGRFKGVPHVRIISPGDKLNINDRPASEFDKMRFQRQWLHFQSDSTKEQIIGTALTEWRKDRPEELSDGQLQELMILKFMSVEQVAMASDAQIQRVGMGAQGLRERARTYLNAKNAQASGAALERANDELLMLKAAFERMQAQMLEMKTAPPKEETFHAGVAKRKGGGGWNKGMKRSTIKKVSDVQHDNAPVGAASV